MKNDFSLRALAVGAAECVAVSASASYVALSAGALPWPTIFIAMASCAILSRFKGFSLREASVAQTLASAGALVSGAVAFTLPGIWILDGGARLSKAALAAALAAVLGTSFAALFRRRLLSRHEFPIGLAAYDAMAASCKGGGDAARLFGATAFSGAFAFLRDGLRAIPVAVQIPFPNPAFSAAKLWLSPMALGIGALVGARLALVWLLSALAANFALSPIFESIAGGGAALLKENVGLGLMVGFGAGTFARNSALAAISASKNGLLPSKRKALSLALAAVLSAALVRAALGASFACGAVVFAGMFFAAFLAGTLTGQTGINPMEVFAILVMALSNAIFSHSAETSILTAMCVAISAALAGDAMNDLKSGSLLGTSARAQLAAEAIGGAIGALVSVSILFSMQKRGIAFGSAAFPAPQAMAVSHLAKSVDFPAAFFSAAAVGAILAAANLPAATLGLGVFLPFQISSAIGVGALLAFAMKKLGKKPDVFASGFLAGEGLAGAALAAASFAGAT